MAPFYGRKDTLHLEGLGIDWMYRFRRLAPNAFHCLSRFGAVHEKHVTIMSRLFMAVTRTSNMCVVVAADTYYISEKPTGLAFPLLPSLAATGFESRPLVAGPL
jgi:hypothetical protein